MVILVCEDDRLEHSDAGLGEDLFPAKGQPPVSLCRLFTHAAKALLRRSNTLIESGMNLFHIARSRRVKSGLGGVKFLKLRNPCQSTRNARHVKSQLAERHYLGWGLHDSLSAGTRSKTRLVMAVSSRNSFSIGSIILVICVSPHWVRQFCSSLGSSAYPQVRWNYI